MSDYIYRCNLTRQYERYKREIDGAIKKTLESGVYILNREVELFEEEFAKYIGRSFGVAVASGTDALILALKAAGLKKQDRVITSTYVSTPVPTAIVHAGGIPVFTDIEEESYLMNPLEVEKKISTNTRFIIPVHLFGSVCDVTAINKTAKKNHICIIEDAAQAHGSIFRNKKAGSFGRLSCFSFYPTKNLGAYGDAGMVLTDSRRIRDRLRLLRNYGKKNNPFDSQILGFNSRLDELQAAVLRVKLHHLDEMNKKRTRLVEIYKRELKSAPIIFPKIEDHVKSNYHILAVLCENGRSRLVKFLAANKIQTNIYYPRPLHLMPAFRKYVSKYDKFPVSEKISKQVVAFPLYPEMEEEKVIFISKKIKEYFFKRG